VNRNDIFTADQIHVGFGKFDDLGVFNPEMYERNLERANNKKLQPCNHCGRGLNPDTAFIAIYNFSSGQGAFIAQDATVEQLMSFKVDTTSGYSANHLAWDWVFLGSECAKQLPENFRLRLADFDDSKWFDTPVHHETNWGTW
jgi:hypothetical protein